MLILYIYTIRQFQLLRELGREGAHLKHLNSIYLYLVFPLVHENEIITAKKKVQRFFCVLLLYS